MSHSTRAILHRRPRQSHRSLFFAVVVEAAKAAQSPQNAIANSDDPAVATSEPSPTADGPRGEEPENDQTQEEKAEESTADPGQGEERAVAAEASSEALFEQRLAQMTKEEEVAWTEKERKLPEAERVVRRRVRAARRRARLEKLMKDEIAKHELAARRTRVVEESDKYWQLFMEQKSLYEVEKDNIRHSLGLPLKSADTLRELREAGLLTLGTVGELRAVLHDAGRQPAQIQAQIEMYTKKVKSLLGLPESSTEPVDPELIALCGDFFIQSSRYMEERKDSDYGGVYSLRGYPGFSNYFGRKQEELWYMTDESGRIRRELLRSDQGVIEFNAMGEMMVHKAALANAKRLRDWWTTERWKYSAIVDRRIDSDSVIRTEGTGGLMRILNIFTNIFRKMLEARSASDEDYDYPFELPYQKPYYGVKALWTKEEEDRYEQLNRLPLIGALAHNDVLPEYRMRTNMNKMSWYKHWFREKCLMMSIPMVDIDHMLDTGGRRN